MSDSSWHIALKALMDADTPEGWGRVVETHRAELLTPLSLLTMKRTLDDARRNGSRMVGALEIVYDFLNTANERGIAVAVAAENERREQILHAIAAFMSAPVGSTGQILRHYQQVLLTTDAVRMAKRTMTMLASQDEPTDSMLPLRQAVRQAQMAFLEEALAQGVDAAEHQYATRLEAALGNSVEAFLEANGGTDAY